MENNNKTIWTIGHSTHSLDEFTAILKSFQIEHLVDIRSLPGSRKFPQFDKEALTISMPERGIEYSHLLILGGRRKFHKDSHNTVWRHPSFRAYADYMETEDFKKGIEELQAFGREKRTAYMCAEVLWWRCHRSMVSDYLKAKGWKVMHIMGVEKSEEHPYTKPATVINGVLTYGPSKEDTPS